MVAVLLPLGDGDTGPKKTLSNHCVLTPLDSGVTGTKQAPFPNENDVLAHLDSGATGKKTSCSISEIGMLAPLDSGGIPPNDGTPTKTGVLAPLASGSILSNDGMEAVNHLSSAGASSDVSKRGAGPGQSPLNCNQQHRAPHSDGLKPLAGRVPWSVERQDWCYTMARTVITNSQSEPSMLTHPSGATLMDIDAGHRNATASLVDAQAI